MPDASGNGIIVIGAGGHAKVVADALRASGEHVLGFTDRNPDAAAGYPDGPPVLGDDSVLADFDAATVRLVLGIGSLRPEPTRGNLFEKLQNDGFRFATVRHPSAIVADDVVLEDGCQIMAGAVIQPGCRIGAGTIVNTSASIDHDSTIGRFVHIAPGATLSGGVTLGDGCHVGVGATIVQNVTIGEGAFVTAGAVVVSDVPSSGRRDS